MQNRSHMVWINRGLVELIINRVVTFMGMVSVASDGLHLETASLGLNRFSSTVNNDCRLQE